MNYNKPQVASVADALTAIQQSPLIKIQSCCVDNHGNAHLRTINAYSGDE